MSSDAVVDALVIGGGLAGLYGVLHLPEEWDVVVVDKGAGAGSSPLAQGGMAVPVGPDDSSALHAADTVRAGAGACVSEAVDVVTSLAISALDELVALGCAFDKARDGSWDLNREGGQTVARSVHWADATGRELMRVVVEHARRRARRVIGSAVRLLVSADRCIGAIVLTENGPVPFLARGVLLASGGCGALYEATTNQPASTGDAVTLAFEAGADVADLEFVQFHPTALARGGHQRVLLTEALRGEGATVVDGDGKRFLFDDHPDGELAPRDVVARAIAERGGALLDARPIGAAHIRERFPNVYAAVADSGFDLAAAPVPVSPAAHYFLGGVRTDVEGRTSVPGLYAAGECAATGVHGANRMAGNSLTESVVFGRLAALALAHDGAPRPRASGASGPPVRDGSDPDEAWAALRKQMTTGAGLVRTADALRTARDTITTIADRACTERLRMAAVAAGLMCGAALERDESRGVHFRSDAPSPDPAWDGRHVVVRAGTASTTANP
jgi:L-aspartate oxidase